MEPGVSAEDGVARTVRARLREFVIPLVQDGLVVGHDAAIGCEALRRAVQLLVAVPFEQIDLEDDVIGAVLVRSAILRRIPKAALVSFLQRKVKPFMGSDEILHFSIETELALEERGI
jgi:hypothetical protein